MYLVVVSNMSGPTDDLARTLAEATGKTAYEMRARAMAPEGGPTVVGSYADPTAAESVAQPLRAAGLRVLVDTPEGIRGGWQSVTARRIELPPGALMVEERDDTRHTITDVDALIAGVGVWTEIRTETQQGRKFSAGHALMTGGLRLTQKTTTTTTSKISGGDRYLAVFAGPRCFLLYEGEVQYQGLGALLQPSRAANFMVVLRELRARFGGAIHDDRLQSRAGQVQVLGASLRPEDHGDLAAALVARTLIDARGPR